jgi:DNA-binding LacI/PurR family transcriptional regulator
MVGYLRETGRRRIATITGPLDTPGGAQRLAGYREVLADAGMPELVANGDYSERSGEEAMERLLGREPGLDAVFVASDLMARGALKALHHAGRKVPDDVAVAGFDDSVVAAATDPPLTTVSQPFPRIAAAMVRLLLSMVDGAPPASIVLPTDIVVRESA